MCIHADTPSMRVKDSLIAKDRAVVNVGLRVKRQSRRAAGAKAGASTGATTQPPNGAPNRGPDRVSSRAPGSPPVRVRRAAAVCAPALAILAIGLWGLDRGGMWRDEAVTFQVAR